MDLDAVGVREAHEGQDFMPGVVHQGGEFRKFGPQLVSHGTLAASGPGPREPGALRTKCTRQRCQLVLSTLLAAALSPSWASEMTSFTPRKPRRVPAQGNAEVHGKIRLAVFMRHVVARQADHV